MTVFAASGSRKNTTCFASGFEFRLGHDGCIRCALTTAESEVGCREFRIDAGPARATMRTRWIALRGSPNDRTSRRLTVGWNHIALNPFTQRGAHAQHVEARAACARARGTGWVPR